MDVSCVEPAGLGRETGPDADGAVGSHTAEHFAT